MNATTFFKSVILKFPEKNFKKKRERLNIICFHSKKAMMKHTGCFRLRPFRSLLTNFSTSMKKSIYQGLFLSAFALMMVVFACKKEEIKQPFAEFSAQATDLTVKFTNTSTDAVSYSWNFGDNTPASTEASPTHTYAVKGKYTVTLTATGAGGSTPSTKTTQLTLVVSCKAKQGNLLKGGNFETSDAAAWTVLTTTKDETANNVLVPVNYKFGATENGPTACDGGGGCLLVTDKTPGKRTTEGSIFYQRLDLQPGDYQWSCDLKVNTGTNKKNTADMTSAFQFWYEVYVDEDTPKEADGFDKKTLIAGLNFWVADPPGTEIPVINGSFSNHAFPFDQISIRIADKDGKFKITKAGTYSVAFKMGKWQGSYGDKGIAIDNMALVKL
jgi:PKD repeat protein